MRTRSSKYWSEYKRENIFLFLIFKRIWPFKGNRITIKCWVNAHRWTTYENIITKDKIVSGNRLLL